MTITPDDEDFQQQFDAAFRVPRRTDRGRDLENLGEWLSRKGMDAIYALRAALDKYDIACGDRRAADGRSPASEEAADEQVGVAFDEVMKILVGLLGSSGEANTPEQLSAALDQIWVELGDDKAKFWFIKAMVENNSKSSKEQKDITGDVRADIGDIAKDE